VAASSNPRRGPRSHLTAEQRAEDPLPELDGSLLAQDFSLAKSLAADNAEALAGCVRITSVPDGDAES
jgi:hypothetical protein